MKTREAIYGNEAAEYLKYITLYHNIRKEQLFRLFPQVKPEVYEKILFHLQNNRRIHHDKETNIIYDTNYQKTDFEIIYCLWVVCDFIEKIEYHSSSDFPVNVVFFGEGELYEITYIPENKEAIFEQAFNNYELNGKRIIVLENTEQITKINIPDVTAYCIVDDNTGEVKYFKSK